MRGIEGHRLCYGAPMAATYLSDASVGHIVPPALQPQINTCQNRKWFCDTNNIEIDFFYNDFVVVVRV